MKSTYLIITLLPLSLALLVVHWQYRNILLACGPSSKLVHRHVKLPTGNRCSVCQITNICFMEHYITLSPHSRSTIQEQAEKRTCQLGDEQGLQFMKRRIRFRRMEKLYKGDLLDPEYMISKRMYKRKMRHIPHYVEFALQAAIRTSTLIELANMTAVDPLLITPTFKKSKQWFDGVHQLFKIVFNHARVTDHQQSTCFHSVFLSKCDGVAPETVIFQQRVAAAVDNHNEQTRAATKPASIQVAILSRAETRRILNVESATRAIRSAFANHDTPPQVKLIQFEEKPFRYQVEEMINADVLIGAHGAGMTNILFMRQGSSVIEIIPFGMERAGFRRLSRLAGLHYERIFAPADEKSVERCAKDKMLGEEFWKQWKLALSGQMLSVGEDATERDCVRRQDLEIPERDLDVALKRIAKRYQDGQQPAVDAASKGRARSIRNVTKTRP